MKKLFLTMCLVIVAHTAFAQIAGSLIDQFKNEPKAEFVHIPRLMMAMGKITPKGGIYDKDDPAGNDIIKKISSMRMLDLGCCSPDTKQRFQNAIANLNTKGYEELIHANDDGDNTRILTKMKGGKICELLILNGSNDDCTVVELKGKIRTSDLSKLMNGQGKYNF